MFGMMPGSYIRKGMPMIWNVFSIVETGSNCTS